MTRAQEGQCSPGHQPVERASTLRRISTLSLGDDDALALALSSLPPPLRLLSSRAAPGSWRLGVPCEGTSEQAAAGAEAGSRSLTTSRAEKAFLSSGGSGTGPSPADEPTLLLAGLSTAVSAGPSHACASGRKHVS